MSSHVSDLVDVIGDALLEGGDDVLPVCLFDEEAAVHHIRIIEPSELARRCWDECLLGGFRTHSIQDESRILHEFSVGVDDLKAATLENVAALANLVFPVPRSKWRDGHLDSEIWMDEPDHAYWIDEGTGRLCVVLRVWSGHLCGYVGFEPGQSLFEGMGYLDIYPQLHNAAHGGITFVGGCPAPFLDCHERSWIGFDASHLGDASPMGPTAFGFLGQYRSMAYMKQSCVAVAAAIDAVGDDLAVAAAIDAVGDDLEGVP